MINNKYLFDLTKIKFFFYKIEYFKILKIL